MRILQDFYHPKAPDPATDDFRFESHTTNIGFGTVGFMKPYCIAVCCLDTQDTSGQASNAARITNTTYPCTR